MTYQDFTKLSERELDECCARADGWTSRFYPAYRSQRHGVRDTVNAFTEWKRPDGTVDDRGAPRYIDSDGLTVHGLRLAKKAVEKDGIAFMLFLIKTQGTLPDNAFDQQLYLATAFVSEPKAVLYAAINALASTSGSPNKPDKAGGEG